LTAKTLLATGVGGYGLTYEEGANLDVVAGARLWSLNSEMDFSSLGSFDATKSWDDPVVDLKGHASISPDFFLAGWALVSDFGVSSKFMWDVMGSVGYNFNVTFSMTAGYRGVGVNCRNDGFVYDVIQSGPTMGFVFKF